MNSDAHEFRTRSPEDIYLAIMDKLGVKLDFGLKVDWNGSKYIRAKKELKDNELR